MSKRILLVDDEPNLLEAIWRMIQIEEGDWEVDFALSVDEALEKTAEHQYDAIVSDVKMPDKSGLELLATLREEDKTREIPVLILTGSTQSQLKEQALETGATDVMNKPFTVDQLLMQLRTVLGIESAT